MKHGFIKVAAATVPVRVADVAFNTESIKECIRQADEAGVNLLVLPELCVTGATCGDLFLTDTLLNAAEKALRDIEKATEGLYPVVVVGAPIRQLGRVYNTAAVIHNGEILGIVPKTVLSRDEKRVFASGKGVEDCVALGNDSSIPFGNNLIFPCDTLLDFIFAIEIGNEGLSLSAPSIEAAKNGATIIANPTAVEALVAQEDYRRREIASLSSRLACGYVSAAASCTESTTDFVMGDHHLIAENGRLLAEHPLFGEDRLLISEIDVSLLQSERRKDSKWETATEAFPCPFPQDLRETILTRTCDRSPFSPADADMDERCETILQIQAHGLKKRFEHARSATAVLGISGGLDSTLALLAAVRAFDLMGKPRTEIRCITMPCFGTTARTKSNAVTLCEELGVSVTEINITAAVRQHFADIGHDESVTDVTYENSQARERTQVLMDMANRCNGLVIGTGDLSELALGWATYNGDHMSMYSVNGSIPKTLVRRVVAYEADRIGGKVCETLRDILDTPVSPELLPATNDGKIAQKTEDLVGPYELHDFFLYYFLRYGMSPAKIDRLANRAFAGVYDSATIRKWLTTFMRRFFIQQFKRSCLPDGPKVGRLSLSPRGDWQMPSDAAYALYLKELEELS